MTIRPRVGTYVVKCCSDLEQISKLLVNNWIFRGMPDFNFRLLSNMERNLPDLIKIKSVESAFVGKLHKVHIREKGRSANRNDIISNFMKLQHFSDGKYGTRFLDFTENFWIAVWFAVQFSFPGFQGKDAVVWSIKTQNIPYFSRNFPRNKLQNFARGVVICGRDYSVLKRQKRQEGVFLVPQDFIDFKYMYSRDFLLQPMDFNIADQLGVSIEELRSDYECINIQHREMVAWKIKIVNDMKLDILNYMNEKFSHINESNLFPEIEKKEYRSTPEDDIVAIMERDNTLDELNQVLKKLDD